MLSLLVQSAALALLATAAPTKRDSEVNYCDNRRSTEPVDLINRFSAQNATDGVQLFTSTRQGDNNTVSFSPAGKVSVVSNESELGLNYFALTFSGKDGCNVTRFIEAVPTTSCTVTDTDVYTALIKVSYYRTRQ